MGGRNGLRDWILGVIGALAISGILGSLKLYSDIQVHFNSPMHPAADKEFDKIKARLTEVESQLVEEINYNYYATQLLYRRAGISMPAKND